MVCRSQPTWRHISVGHKSMLFPTTPQSLLFLVLLDSQLNEFVQDRHLKKLMWGRMQGITDRK
jgi:hypothetical protein